MVTKTEAIKMLMNKMGKAMRKWARRMTKPAEGVKMPSQRTTVAQMTLMM